MIQGMALSLVEFICFWIVLRIDGKKDFLPSVPKKKEHLGEKTVADCEGA